MKGFINVSILYLYWFLYLYLSLYLYLRLYSSSPSDQLASVPGEWRLVHICYKLSICRCCFSSAPGHFGRRTARPGHIMISQRGPTTDAHHTSPFWAISISASQWIHSSFLYEPSRHLPILNKEFPRLSSRVLELDATPHPPSFNVSLSVNTYAISHRN